MLYKHTVNGSSRERIKFQFLRKLQNAFNRQMSRERAQVPPHGSLLLYGFHCSFPPCINRFWGCLPPPQQETLKVVCTLFILK